MSSISRHFKYKFCCCWKVRSGELSEKLYAFERFLGSPFTGCAFMPDSSSAFLSRVCSCLLTYGHVNLTIFDSYRFLYEEDDVGN